MADSKFEVSEHDPKKKQRTRWETFADFEPAFELAKKWVAEAQEPLVIHFHGPARMTDAQREEVSRAGAFLTVTKHPQS